jgi:hypothetical protein
MDEKDELMVPRQRESKQLSLSVWTGLAHQPV